jgi:hypothetical protein
MEVWLSIAALATTLISLAIAHAVRHGRLLQRVTVLERDVITHTVSRDALEQQITQQLRAINSVLGDLRSSLARMEGYQEAQRERQALQRRDTIPPQ